MESLESLESIKNELKQILTNKFSLISSEDMNSLHEQIDNWKSLHCLKSVKNEVAEDLYEKWLIIFENLLDDIQKYQDNIEFVQVILAKFDILILHKYRELFNGSIPQEPQMTSCETKEKETTEEKTKKVIDDGTVRHYLTSHMQVPDGCQKCKLDIRTIIPNRFYRVNFLSPINNDLSSSWRIEASRFIEVVVKASRITTIDRTII